MKKITEGRSQNPELLEILKEISHNPELFEQLVVGYLEKHPDSSKEEVGLYLIRLISDECSKEADEEKIQNQRDITRDRVISEVLNYIPDSGDLKNKKTQIKKASTKVSYRNISYEKENLADLLKDCSDSGLLKIKKRKIASDEIGRDINYA